MKEHIKTISLLITSLFLSFLFYDKTVDVFKLLLGITTGFAIFYLLHGKTIVRSSKYEKKRYNKLFEEYQLLVRENKSLTKNNNDLGNTLKKQREIKNNNGKVIKEVKKGEHKLQKL